MKIYRTPDGLQRSTPPKGPLTIAELEQIRAFLESPPIPERGEKGERGADGLPGRDGRDGLNGADGRDGVDANAIPIVPWSAKIDRDMKTGVPLMLTMTPEDGSSAGISIEPVIDSYSGLMIGARIFPAKRSAGIPTEDFGA